MIKRTLIILLILGFLFSCNKSDSKIIKSQGLVDADVITIKSLVSGKIIINNTENGKLIKRGDLLIKIDDNKVLNQLKGIELNLKEIDLTKIKLKIRLKTLKQNISYLKKQYERFLRLSKKKAVSGEKLEKMKLNLDEALNKEKELLKEIEIIDIKSSNLLNKRDYLNLILKDYSIKSPINGIILEKFISLGENLFPTSPIVDIYDYNSLYMDIFIQEDEVTRIKLNQEVEIRVDGINKLLKGKVIQFGRKAEFSPKYIISEKERKSLLYKVRIKPINDLDIYKIGMPVTIIIK